MVPRAVRRGNFFNRFRFVPFRSVSYRLRGPGMRGSRLHGNDGGCQECAGVVKLLISAHFRSFPLIPLVGAGDGGGRDARFPPSRGTTGTRRVNDVYSQCKGWRGGGAMGSCRRVGVGAPPKQGCEVPAFAGNDGGRGQGCARTLILTFSQREKGSARLRGNPSCWPFASPRYPP